MRGKDIFEYRVPRSGLTYSPLLHWRLVAKWAEYSWPEWEKLEPDLQAFEIAAYETHMQAEAVLHEEQRKKAEQQAKRGKSGSPPHRPRRRR